MARPGKPKKVKVVAKRSLTRKLPKERGTISALEKRLAEALKRKTGALEQLQTRDRELAEARAQQTATAEVLRVIASSPADLQAVLDAVTERAARLCGANDGVIMRVDGDVLRRVAHAGDLPVAAGTPPRPINHRTVGGRVVLQCRTVHVPDVLDPAFAAEFPESMFASLGVRTVLAAPLLRERLPIGVIMIRRVAPQPFSDNQIALLQTFADQAVIALETVRLFTELQQRNRDVTEALEQQTATSEILRVIARSPTDVRPVFDAIARNAARLCGGAVATVNLLSEEWLEVVGRYDYPADVLSPRTHVKDAPYAVQVIREGTVFCIMDSENDSRVTPVALQRLRASRTRAFLSVPLMHHARAIGSISIGRREPGSFLDQHIDVLKTFADQAVIAIENVRLFNELEARTQDLARSVSELRALSEVGQAISSTLDLETVLTTIVSRAVGLSGLDGGVVFEYDEGANEFVHRVATDAGGTLAEARRATRVRKGEGVVGQTALTLEPAQVADITAPGAYESRLRENLIASGIRAVLAVPMVREGELIGCLVVSRNGPGEFPAETIELLRTFATQSALAIQNARLFREIEQKSRELEAASRHKSEFLANMSHELRTPLNAIIGYSEMLQEEAQDRHQDSFIPDLEKISAAAKHQVSLINDILDLSKVEAGRMELEAADFDLPGAIDSALTLVRERATRRGITLGREIDGRMGVLQGDERKVRQVLLNLLSNAIKFTPEGGRIDVRAAVGEGLVEVSVTDSGVGIAPQDQDAIFEEFRQVGTAEKKVEGTGLGLALARRFIELHGGRIWVTSQVGRGSTFTFTLPVRRRGE